MNKEHAQAGTCGLPASKWREIFRNASVETVRLDGVKSLQSQATIIGNFLGRVVDRATRIEVDSRTGTATLRRATGRANQNVYWFEIEWDTPEASSDNSAPSPQPIGNAGKQLPAAKAQGVETQSTTITTRTAAATKPTQQREAPVTIVAGNKGNNEVWE